jgi:hypothetical protein
VLAESDDDLDSRRPAAGPRLVVSPSSIDPVGDALAALPLGLETDSAADVVRVVDEPHETTYGGFAAIVVVVEDVSGEQSFTRRYAVVYHDGTADLILMEAPNVRWAEIGPLLDALLDRSLGFRS